MVDRDKIITYTEELLKVEDFSDSCHNGLQIFGKNEINKIITGVSLSQKLIEAAIKEQADMIMVHHGVFINDIPTPLILKGVWRNRLAMILSHNINLAAWHLPLDAEPKFGNNISMVKMLKLKNPKPLGVGFIAETGNKKKFADLVSKIKKVINPNIHIIGNENIIVNKVAIISGSASKEVITAISAGADVFITGDMRENIFWQAQEMGINLINAGHYATEVFGIKNLGEHLKKVFGIKTKFIDFVCPV